MYKHTPLGVTIISLLIILGGLAFLASASAASVLIPLFVVFIGSDYLVLYLSIDSQIFFIASSRFFHPITLTYFSFSNSL